MAQELAAPLDARGQDEAKQNWLEICFGVPKLPFLPCAKLTTPTPTPTPESPPPPRGTSGVLPWRGPNKPGLGQEAQE